MNKNVLSYLLGFTTAIIMLLGGSVLASELNIIPNPFPVYIDDVQVDMEGYLINDSSYFKLRDYDKAGLQVDFKDKKILITTNKEVSTMIKTNVVTKDEIIKTTYNGAEAIEKDGVLFILLPDLSKFATLYSQNLGNNNWKFFNSNFELIFNKFDESKALIYIGKLYIKYDLVKSIVD